MIAAGCVFLIVFPLVGLCLGLWAGGTQAAIWSAVAGFALAAAICGTATYALIKAGRQR